MPNTSSEKQKWQQNLKADELKQIVEGKIDPTKPEEHGWIHITLRDNKLNYRVKEARSIVLVGCGSYPYSLFDMRQKYPDKMYIGVDYDIKCIKMCYAICNKYKINDMNFIHGEGKKLDYSKLTHSDMVFLSADIDDMEDTYWHIIKDTPAQVFICKPHTKSPGIYPGD